jgi:hypothetical protein
LRITGKQDVNIVLPQGDPNQRIGVNLMPDQGNVEQVIRSNQAPHYMYYPTDMKKPLLAMRSREKIVVGSLD